MGGRRRVVGIEPYRTRRGYGRSGRPQDGAGEPVGAHPARFDEELRRDRRERLILWLLAGITAFALLAWMVWSSTEERRAIARLPADQRQVIYEHGLETLRTMCTGATDTAVRRRCREQAEFLLKFPECDADCGKEIAPYLRRATR